MELPLLGVGRVETRIATGLKCRMPVADWILLRSDARAKGQLALNPVQLLNIGAVSSTLTQI
jgi:hypothetical protein